MKKRRHKQALEFSILQTLRFMVMGVILAWMYFALAFLQSVEAAGSSKGAIPQNPCAVYKSLQKTPMDTSVVKVQFLGVQNGRVGIMILGLPKHVQATMNGIDVKPYLEDTQQIICEHRAVGELRSYNLSQMQGMDAGYFQLKTDQKSVGASVNLR